MNATKPQIIHLLAVTDDKALKDRLSELAKDFEYNIVFANNVNDIADKPEDYENAKFSLVAANKAKEQEIAGYVQVMKQFVPNSYISIIVDKKVSPESAQFIKKSGANMVILENEIYESSKLEYITSQVIRATMVPVKASDFIVGSTVDYNVYHIMPLNQKMLPVVTVGTQLDESRVKKLSQVGEFFLKRDDIVTYKEYLEKNTDLSADGLKKRCRAKYLALCHTHSQLAILLTNQSEQASFALGKTLYDRCYALASDFLTTLSSTGNPWEIVNNSSIGEFGSVERSPAIAAYAAMIALENEIGDPMTVMLAALLADVGMLELSPKISRSLRVNKSTDKLNAEDRAEYEKHPIFSVNSCLSRKLQLPEAIKENILASHERIDEKGFPNHVAEFKIPEQAMLIQFCELVDRGMSIEMGQKRPDYPSLKNQLVEQERKAHNRFSESFLSKL